MRAYFHIINLIRLLTFASVIGKISDMLSVSGAPVDDDLSKAMTTISFSIYENSTSIIMSSSTEAPGTPSTISAKTIYKHQIRKYPVDFTSILSKKHWANTDPATASTTSGATTGPERQRTFRNKHHHEHHWGPFFEEPLNTTSGDHIASTAYLFTEAILNCRVGMLKDKTVMWVRRTSEKVSLLTVGNVTYSGDPRIKVKFQYPNNWRLLINPVLKEDAGLYMCQVSTYPPRVFATNLTILEPPLRVIDDQEREVSDRYYKSGSPIDLQCQISKSYLDKEILNILRSNPNKTHTNKITKSINDLGTNETHQIQFEKKFKDYILWKKDGDLLSTVTVRRSSSSERWLHSRISISDAKLSDSGNYSCSIGKLFKVVVQVQVLTGELPAAVQHNSKVSIKCTHPQQALWILLIIAFALSPRYISPTP